MEEACLEASYKLRQDAKVLLEKSVTSNNTRAGSQVLAQLIANYQAAASKKMPLCQDCGYITAFAELGNKVVIEDGTLSEAIQGGVSGAYSYHNLRQSVIADALFERDNFKPRKMAKIHISLTRGDKLKITIMPKGGGSDNASRMKMMKPTAGVEEILEFITKTIKETAISACPPLFIGVGIGGSFDTVGVLAKKALLKSFEKPNTDPKLDKLEKYILEAVNKLGIGPGGLGGDVTALGVSVLTGPSHMASLPVAININCNSLRSVEIQF